MKTNFDPVARSMRRKNATSALEPTSVGAFRRRSTMARQVNFVFAINPVVPARHNACSSGIILYTVMKRTCLLLAVVLVVQQMSAQVPDDIHGSAVKDGEVTNAPLLLYTTGEGRILPFHYGQMLQVGRKYRMIAIPDRGFVFTNWNPVNVFTLTSAEIDYNTSPPTTNFVTSVDLSPVPAYTKNPLLRFTMEPEEVLFETNGNSLTVGIGWQANFVPGRRPGFERDTPRARDCK